MSGTILNAAGILLGGIIGLFSKKNLSRANESCLQTGLAAFTAFYGLRLVWTSLGGTGVQVMKQLVVMVLAVVLGRLVGKAIGLQKLSNRLGRQARARISQSNPQAPNRNNEGFKACAALFCASPLGIIGALEDGLSLSRYFYPLAVKAVLDGLATLGLTRVFGAGVLLSALPVLVFQGTITLVGARALEPFLTARDLLAPVEAVAGILLSFVALVMLGLKRVALADYLPSLLLAPLLAWWWR